MIRFSRRLAVLASAAALALTGLLPATAAHAASGAPDDWNGDGRSDLFTLGFSNQLGVSVDPTYPASGAGIQHTITVGYKDIAAPGDLDGDGKPDVLAATESGTLYLYSSAAGDLSGSSSAPAPKSVGTGWQIYSKLISPGDLTGDGRSDLLARGYDGSLWLYAGTGSASSPLKSRVLVGTGWNMYDQVLGVGDVAGTGYGDVLARDPQGRLWLYPGTGGGKLGARSLVGTGWGEYNQLLGYLDLNGDGKPDLAARTPSGALYLYPGLGGGKFGPRVYESSGWAEDEEFANQGGLMVWGKDNVIGRRSDGSYGYYYALNNGRLSGNQGDPWSGYQQLQQTSQSTNTVALKDDQQLSAVYRDPSDNWLATPSSMDLDVVYPASAYNLFLGPGDLNTDGHSDLLARSTGGYLYLFPGTGNGTFGSRVSLGSGWNTFTRILGAGDLTGDGRPDIVGVTASGLMYLYPGLGNGHFGSAHYVGSGWNYARMAAPGDLNGDGKADLVAIDSSGNLWAYYGTGTSGFQPRALLGTGWNTYRSLS